MFTRKIIIKWLQTKTQTKEADFSFSGQNVLRIPVNIINQKEKKNEENQTNKTISVRFIIFVLQNSEISCYYKSNVVAIYTI